jgi:hypothetical protein
MYGLIAAGGFSEFAPISFDEVSWSWWSENSTPSLSHPSSAALRPRSLDFPTIRVRYSEWISKARGDLNEGRHN